MVFYHSLVVLCHNGCKMFEQRAKLVLTYVMIQIISLHRGVDVGLNKGMCKTHMVIGATAIVVGVAEIVV